MARERKTAPFDITAVSVGFDMRFALDMSLSRQERGNLPRLRSKHIECEQREHISNANGVSVYRIARQGNISSRALRDLSTKRSETIMEEKKNELREMTITFALSVSEVCDEIKGCRSYVDQMIR